MVTQQSVAGQLQASKLRAIAAVVGVVAHHCASIRCAHDGGPYWGVVRDGKVGAGLGGRHCARSDLRSAVCSSQNCASSRRHAASNRAPAEGQNT